MTPPRVLHLGACAALAAAALGVAAAPAGASRTLVLHTVSVGVKGGESNTGADLGNRDDYAATQALSGSLSVSGRMRDATFTPSSSTRGIPRTGNVTGRATVNGTWSMQGAKWVSYRDRTTTQFTCAGTMGLTVQPQMSLSWRRKGSSYRFTLHALQQEVYENGLGACPSGAVPGPLHAASPQLFTTTFSIPYRSMGARTLKRRVSGPLAANRVFFTQNCPRAGACSLAWQGTVTFRRTRTIRLG
jgi:hypothetical protein